MILCPWKCSCAHCIYSWPALPTWYVSNMNGRGCLSTSFFPLPTLCRRRCIYMDISKTHLILLHLLFGLQAVPISLTLTFVQLTVTLAPIWSWHSARTRRLTVKILRGACTGRAAKDSRKFPICKNESWKTEQMNYDNASWFVKHWRQFQQATTETKQLKLCRKVYCEINSKLLNVRTELWQSNRILQVWLTEVWRTRRQRITCIKPSKESTTMKNGNRNTKAKNFVTFLLCHNSPV